MILQVFTSSSQPLPLVRTRHVKWLVELYGYYVYYSLYIIGLNKEATAKYSGIQSIT